MMRSSMPCLSMSRSSHTRRAYIFALVALCYATACSFDARTDERSSARIAAQAATQNATHTAAPDTAAPGAPRTPTETVREFYARLRARRFQEALMMSVYRPAVEQLDAAELAELRPEFEALAATVPAEMEITGEQMSGDSATVFLKLAKEQGAKAEVQPVTLMRVGESWIVGDREAAEAVKKLGKSYFIELRIATHHAEAQAMMQRIAQAQLVYSLQHNGEVADMDTLIKENLLPADIRTPDSTGYRYRITPSADRKTFTAGAEPARYDRTGRLSFFADARGMQNKDTGGKPLEGSDIKKPNGSKSGGKK